MTKGRRRESTGEMIGGMAFGFERQVLRTTRPPPGLVHHARPDLTVATGDGTQGAIRQADAWARAVGGGSAVGIDSRAIDRSNGGEPDAR